GLPAPVTSATRPSRRSVSMPRSCPDQAQPGNASPPSGPPRPAGIRTTSVDPLRCQRHRLTRRESIAMTQTPGQWPDPYQPPAPPPSVPPASPTYPAYQTPPPPPYGAPAGYGQVPYAPSRPTNAMALAAMIVSLAGIVTAIGFPVGAILGHVALKQ